jgi:hypothetical protein
MKKPMKSSSKQYKDADLVIDSNGSHLFSIPEIDEEFQDKFGCYVLGRIKALLIERRPTR